MAEQKQVTISDGVEGRTGQQGSRRIGSGAKTEWPEAVGLTAEEAEAKIKEDAPDLNVQVIPPNNFVTMDYNAGRVRIFVDATGKVKKTPKVG
ncbi:Proteinase inhibitor I13 potato inhibitor I protein [Dioscorea alata]|uniref:Proteinase inhibitor I13 potato inhibitor I protein n=1 Tax=Dioscorea alata TaxID=55571 RepID=A0ACB7VGE2_DIOAL|nr:Proteinase inhibitor I13 potato inhibitor I protein [Dioscorea alata]